MEARGVPVAARYPARVSRRRFLLTSAALGVGATATTLLAACAPTAPAAPTPTTAPATKPAAVSGTTAAQPTAPAAAQQAAPAAATQPAASAAAGAQSACGPSDKVATVAKGATPWVSAGYDGLCNPKRGGILRMGLVMAFLPSYDVQQQGTSSPAAYQHGPRYDNLVRYDERDPGGAVVPDLAESWEISPDGKVYTFHLRNGVKFHDGMPFTSADVIATYQRIAKPPQGIVSTRADWFADVRAFEAPDDLTVRISLNKSAPYFLNFLAHAQMGINQKKFLETHNFDLSKTPDYPSTGPFKFKSERPNQAWILERNPNYWNGDMPFLDGIEIYQLDAKAAAAALVAGNVDLVRGGDLPAAEVMRGVSDASVLIQPNTSSTYFWMNRTQKPFDDVRVRQALNLIWDRPALFEASKQFGWLRQGDGWVPAGSLWEKELGGEPWKSRPGLRGVTDADVQQARLLMKDAGYEGGLGNIEVSIRGELTPAGLLYAQVLQASIDKHLQGKTVFAYKSVEFAAAKRIIHDNQFQAMSLASNFGELDHPFIWLRSYWHSQGANQLSNYNSTQFDSLVDELVATADRPKAVELGKQGVDQLYKDLPAIPSGLWSDELSVLKSYVMGSGFKDKKNDGHSAFRRDTAFLNK